MTTRATGVLHPKCGKRFSAGNRAGHCAVCCETFVGGAAFDAHRVGEHGPNRTCQLKPYESLTEAGVITYGHWQDDGGSWHYGKQMTDEDKLARFGTPELLDGMELI